MPSHKALLAVALLGLLPARAAVAQADLPPDDPETLLTDIRLLEDVDTLRLTLDQARAILPHVEQVQAHVQRVADLRTETYRSQARIIYRMRRALAAGRLPPRSDHLLLGRALQRLQRQVDTEERAIEKLAGQVLDELTDAQRNAIETPAEEEARLARLEALGGHTKAADFIVDQLRQMRELLPDEYDRRRLAMVDNILSRVEPPDSLRIPDLRQALLALMDEVYALSVFQFQQRLPGLARDVTVRLTLNPSADVPATEGKLTRDEFQSFLRDRRTARVLSDLLAWRPEGTEPPQ